LDGVESVDSIPTLQKLTNRSLVSELQHRNGLQATYEDDVLQVKLEGTKLCCLAKESSTFQREGLGYIQDECWYNFSTDHRKLLNPARWAACSLDQTVIQSILTRSYLIHSVILIPWIIIALLFFGFSECRRVRRERIVRRDTQSCHRPELNTNTYCQWSRGPLS